MLWSQALFEAEAKRLIEAMDANKHRGIRDSAAAIGLEWGLMQNKGDWQHWMKCRPLTRHSSLTKRQRQPPSASINAIENIEDNSQNNFSLEDNIVLVDPDAVVLPSTSNTHKNESGEAEGEETNKNVWNLSIVYSDTWQCPILYFQVDRLEKDGSLVSLASSRQTVVHMLKEYHHQNHVQDSWEFVSLEEHPKIPRTSSFFLHPCQTKERLETLTAATTTTTTTKSEMASGSHLWSWMSMMLPALGLAVPSKEFVMVQRILKELDTKAG